MNFVAIALIILVIGMMAWPLVLLKPSKKQQQQATRRLTWLKQGLKVQITRPSLDNALSYQYHAYLQSIGIAKPISNSVLKQRYFALRNPHSLEWFWPDHTRPPAATMQKMLAVYQTLPAWCIAIEQGPVNSTIFAQESFIDDTILIQLLDELNQCIQ